MMKTVILLLTWLQLWAFSAMGASPSTTTEFHLQEPEVETLSNGLQIAWFLGDSITLLDMVLVVKAGHRDDPAGASGTSELLAAVLDRGSEGLKAHQIARMIEENAASHSVSVGEETFTVSVHGLSEDSTVLADILKKMTVKPDLAEDEVKREQKNMLERWNHVGDFSDALAALVYHRAITSGTPYGRGSVGSFKEFQKLTRNHLVEFQKKYFTPQNSILIVSGKNISPEGRAQIKAIFGDWTGEKPSRKTQTFSNSEFANSGESVILVNRPEAKDVHVRMGFRVSPLQASDRHGMAVANALLGGFFNSRLNAILRDRLGLTYSVSSALSYNQDLGEFTIASVTRPEAVGQLIRRTQDLIESFQEGTVTTEEIETAKSYLLGSFPLAVQNPTAVANRWIIGNLYRLGNGFLNEWVPKIQSVTLSEVKGVANKNFSMKKGAIVAVGDAKAIRESLSRSKLKVFKQVSLRDLE